MDTISYDKYLEPCVTIAREAGSLIMRYFGGTLTASQKADNSPVTQADIEANQLITRALTNLDASIPVIAEEDDSSSSAIRHPTFWLVDPLDGTRSFVRGEPEFTVNIGLIHRQQPVLGIIYAPPQDIMYWGSGQGAFRITGSGGAERIHARQPARDGLVVVRSQSHPSAKTAAYLETLAIKELIPGSSSIKFCKVAEGSADRYPRFGRTMEWDTAAGHAILNAAGGRVETTDGQPLLYGKPGFENPHFIAYGK